MKLGKYQHKRIGYVIEVRNIEGDYVEYCKDGKPRVMFHAQLAKEFKAL